MPNPTGFPAVNGYYGQVCNESHQRTEGRDGGNRAALRPHRGSRRRPVTHTASEPEASSRPASNGLLAAFHAKVRVPLAVCFGLFFAWQEAVVNLLYPLSNGLVFSPLVCEAFAACLVLVIAFFGVARNRAAFPAKLVLVLAFASIFASTVAALLASAGVFGRGFAYVTAVVVGGAVSMLFYGWADLFLALEPERRTVTAIAGLVVSALIGIAVWWSSGIVVTRVLVAVLGVGTFVGFYLYMGGHDVRADDPLMVRPSRSNHFRLLLVAIVLYALVFGETSGVTAQVASPEVMRSFSLGTSEVMFVVWALLLAVAVAAPQPVRLPTVGRVLTPVLAVLFLSQILLQGSANGWLPRLTAGFWQFVQVFVFLVLIDAAQSGLASLSLVFPLGWAAVSLGFAVGSFGGQLTGGLFGNSDTSVTNITVGLVMVAVVASSILGAAQYPRLDAAPQQPAPEPDAAPEPVGAAPAPDMIAGACADLVGRYALSTREAEVLELLARGNTRASIAEKLCISENTVRVHVKNIYAKLRIHSKQQLIDMVDKRATA